MDPVHPLAVPGSAPNQVIPGRVQRLRAHQGPAEAARQVPEERADHEQELRMHLDAGIDQRRAMSFFAKA